MKRKTIKKWDVYYNGKHIGFQNGETELDALNALEQRNPLHHLGLFRLYPSKPQAPKRK